MHLSVIVSLCRRDGGRQLSPSCDQVLVDDSVCSFFIYIYIYIIFVLRLLRGLIV